MTSNRNARHEVDVAEAHLAVVLELAASASETFDAAAKTVGFAQLATNQLGAAAGVGKTLIDSATKTMELAQAGNFRLHKEVAKAEKELMSVKRKWGLDDKSGGHGANSRGNATVTDSMSRKRRTFEDPNEHINYGSANTHSDGVKKSRIDKAVSVTNTFGAAGTNPTTGISFGSVPANLPAGRFVFGANSATAAGAGSSSIIGDSVSTAGKRKSANESSTCDVARAPKAVLESRKILKASRNWAQNATGSSSIGDSVSPTGKRKSVNESSTSDVARAPKTVLESRRILRASRNWAKKGTEDTDGVKIASKIFASVKLAPSKPTEVKREEQSDAAGPAASASAKPSFASTFASSSTPKPADKGSNKNGEKVTVNPGRPEKAGHDENNEEETLYEVRARHFKRVGDEWKKYDAGELCLYRHKRTSDCSVVIRNVALQVQFNVQIEKGTEFQKVIKETGKGKSAFVRFGAVEDASRGMDTFMLQVKPEFVDELYETLEGMAASE